MNDIVTDNYVGRYNVLYKQSIFRGSFEYALPLKLQAVKIHIPKNFNVMHEMTHRALEHLGVLGKDDTWNFELEPEYMALVVYDKKGEETQWVKLDMKQEALLLYRDRYGSMVRTSELPRYDNNAVMFYILELIPTKEVEVKPTSTKKYVVTLKSGLRLTMELTDEMYKSFTGVGVLADAKQCTILYASEVESIKEVKPVTDHTIQDYLGEDESKPKNHHRFYYSNADGLQPIDVIEDCNLYFHLGNVVKYIMRAGKKTPDKSSDYQKAEWYIRRLLETESLLWEQYKALGPYFDNSGAITQLTENDLLNDSLCSLLMINPIQDSYIEYKKALTNLYYVLHTVIIEELNGGKKHD